MSARLFFAVYCLALFGCAPHSLTEQLPVASYQSSPRPANGNEVIINIDMHGNRVISERRYDSDAALGQLLSDARRNRPRTSVSIRADRRATHESVCRVVFLTRQAGYSSVSIVTRAPTSPLIEELLKLQYE